MEDDRVFLIGLLFHRQLLLLLLLLMFDIEFAVPLPLLLEDSRSPQFIRLLPLRLLDLQLSLLLHDVLLLVLGLRHCSHRRLWLHGLNLAVLLLRL